MATYKHAQNSGASIAVKIIIIVLIIAILGGGAFALYHFVFDKSANTEPTQAPTVAVVATQAPTQAPTEDNMQEYNELARATMASMTEDEKICQLFIVTPETLTGVDGVTQAGDSTKEAIEQYPVGGIVYSAKNFEDAQQTKEMISNTQSYSKIPMFIALCEEGGDNSPAAEKLGTTKLNNMFSYKDADEITAYNNAFAIAKDITALGFNLNMAPVADVFSDSTNKFIGERAYSDDFFKSSDLVANAVKGFKAGNTMCALSHFPGCGEAKFNSDNSVAYTEKTVQELTTSELLPFMSGIKEGADMVMVSHLTVNSIDKDNPATLSSKVISELLTQGLSYNGVVISDSCSSALLTEKFTDEEIAEKSLNAGINIILKPADIEAYVKAVKAAVESGKLNQSTIDESVIKVLALKYKNGLITGSAQTPTTAQSESQSGTTVPTTTVQ